MRLFAASDLHTDYKENLTWLGTLSDTAYRNDALIVAGDISDRLPIIRETLALLRSKFRYVFFTPGNHELWIRGQSKESNSIEKLEHILEVCKTLRVTTTPLKLKDFWVVPLFSWYDGTFPPEMDEEREYAERAWADFHFCKWPEHIKSLPEYFLRLNEPRIKNYDAPVITFSHFLPRADLLPPKEYLKISWLENVSVCEALDAQIRALSARVHVCGHTHTHVNHMIDGVKYIQHALRYPKERYRPRFPIKIIWK